MALDITSYALGKKASGGEEPTGTIEITSNGITNVKDYATADVNVEPDLESKSVTITENTTTTITPTSGKDGISSIEITTNVPSSGNEWADVGWNSTPPYIQSIHTYTKTLYDNWNASSPISIYFTNKTAMIVCPAVDTRNVTTFRDFFSGCTSLKSVPNLDTTSATTYSWMFHNCAELERVDISNYTTANFILHSVGSFGHMFDGCSKLQYVNFGNFQTFDPTKTDNCYLMFNGCTQLSPTTLNDILKLCILYGDNMSNPNDKKISIVGITDSTLLSVIPTLSNYQDFINAGWTLS